ncbi:YggT family protein [Enterococcus cecorum]|uniref:YggT family protein n=1 Tax=Enterococcus cecorum TaxID=44008 RepID=UPI00054D02AE|nr:YggT family protein [uncultured Enterococcus sp.]KLN95065.1 cell division protein [Enterococcus cecorum]KLO67863.1 cell division protein [Enterococcus cecorum]KLO68053.1 cell division protein [Enterococcus cecorum]KLO72082.1 cell division protein [Enterococcus cecorum]KLO73953.1 cell division protein [Enterococcus cecorum]
MKLIGDVVYLYTTLLVIYALLSWFPGGYQSKFGQLLSKICEPYLSIFDRVKLQFGPVDFTILFAVLVLQLASQALIRILLFFVY